MSRIRSSNNLIEKSSDKELVKIVTTEVHKYETEVVQAAERELKKRKISKLQMAQLVKDATLENSSVQEIQNYVSSSGIRFINFVIDFVVFVILSLAGTLVLDSIFTTSSKEILLTVGYGMILIIFLIYYGFSEYYTQKTLGKYVTKTQVVRVDGSKPNASEIAIRTLCRLIPFDRLSYLISQNGFHDRFSNTRVVKQKG